MKLASVCVVALLLAAACSAQTSLYPRHIEQPTYPLIAYTARVSGLVVLTLTIDATGRVVKAEATDGPPLLVAAAVRNILTWTFDRPAAAPFAETFVYDFRIGQAPSQEECAVPSSLVSYELPNRVTIERRPILIVDRFPKKK